MRVNFNLHIKLMNCMLHVGWKQPMKICGRSVGILISMAAQLKRLPRQKITLKSDIFLPYIYPVEFQLTRGTHFWQFFKRSNRSLDFHTWINFKCTSNWCHRDVTQIGPVGKLRNDLVGSIYNTRAIGSTVKQHDGLLSSELPFTQVLYYCAKS
jgi:hypothetical protein